MSKLALVVLLVPLAIGAETIDFEAAALGTVPSGWTVAMTHDGTAPRWAIVEDAGGRALAQLSDDATTDRFPLAIRSATAMTDGTIGVRFKPVAGRVDQAAGLVWRYRDENNYYIVRANALEDNVVLYKVQNGIRTALSPVGRNGEYGVAQAVPAERWSTLAVHVRGTTFAVSFDGEPLYEVRDPTFTGAGAVGLWTKADSVTYFDDFEVVIE